MQSKFSRFIPFILFPLYFLLVGPSSAHAQYLASDLLGQLDANGNPVYTTNNANNGEGAVNARGFSNVRGSTALDSIHHRLFVSDLNNSRVLIFNLDANNNLIDRVADYVIGQPDFTTSTPAVTQSGMGGPLGLVYDEVNNRLFVAQTSHERVLVFDVSTITNGMNASYVIGQTTFTTSIATTSQNGFSGLRGLTYDSVNSRLFTNEISNNRILVFDVNPSTITNGVSASYVLGQTSFTSSSASSSQNGISQPQEDMAYDSETNRLFVGDRGNDRVLIFDFSSGITSGMNASYVLGWTSFASSSADSLTQNTFVTPRAITYDPVGKQLFVGDNDGNRILVFDATTITNGENAVAVIGQSDFISSATGLSQSRVTSPFGLRFDPVNRRLYSSGLTQNRIIIFNFVRMSTSSLASASADHAYSVSLSSTNSQGTVSYATTSGSLPPGLTLTSSTGAITGTPTAIGTYTFTIQATDNNGAIGYFVSQPQTYSITVGPAATVTVGNNNYAPAPAASAPTASQPTPTPITPPASVQPPTFTLPSVTIDSPIFVPLSSPFTQNLKVADKKSDVQSLQQYLNAKGFVLTQSGPGSPGNETSKFGAFTYAALVKFQEAHANEILKPVGLTKGTGYFGPLTRAFVNTHN